jgi:LmbE family N-acetylglucosaminyl deacetylase
MGRQRKREFDRCCDCTGIPEENRFFLGFPNGWKDKLADEYFYPENEPYRDELLDTDRIIFDGAFKPDLPFYGQTVKNLIKELVLRIAPTHIFTHHDKDNLPDHRGVVSLTESAVEEVKKTRLSIKAGVYKMLVYYRKDKWKWPPPGKTFDDSFIRNDMRKFKTVNYKLSPVTLNRKKECCLVFTPMQPEEYILKYMKTNEIFWLDFA